MSKRSRMVLQNIEKTCLLCHSKLSIFKPEDHHQPAFQICFKCETFHEIGVGPVTRIVSDGSLSITSYIGRMTSRKASIQNLPKPQ